MSRPPLANAELALMELLWEQERMTARELRERLYPDASRAQHGTVQKLLAHLEGALADHRELGAVAALEVFDLHDAALGNEPRVAARGLGIRDDNVAALDPTQDHAVFDLNLGAVRH